MNDRFVMMGEPKLISSEEPDGSQGVNSFGLEERRKDFLRIGNKCVSQSVRMLPRWRKKEEES